MADADNVISVLRTRLTSIVDLWPVVYTNPDILYTPVKGTSFIEESFAFGSDFDTATGPIRWRRYDEAYQLMLCVPAFSGVLEARTMANKIRDAFLASAMTLPSGARLIVTSTQTQPPRIDSSWLKLPVVISYTYTTPA